jgi:hypothetical protein
VLNGTNAFNATVKRADQNPCVATMDVIAA